MSDSLMSRVSDLLDARNDDYLSPVSWRARRAMDREGERGMVRAERVRADTYVAHERVQGASFVARMGMHRAAELSHEAMRFTAQSPTAAGRFEAIADAFASVVVNEVIKLGYDGR